MPRSRASSIGPMITTSAPVKLLPVVLEQAAHPRVRVRCVDGDEAPSRVALPRGVDRGADLGGVMRVVVDDGHAATLAEDLETASRTAEIGAGVPPPSSRSTPAYSARMSAAHAFCALWSPGNVSAHLAAAAPRCAPPRTRCTPLLVACSEDPPVARRVHAICDDNGAVPRPRARGIRDRRRRARARRRRHRRGELDERLAVRVEVAYTSGWSSSRRVTHAPCGLRVQELRARIPGRRRVLVALEHEGPGARAARCRRGRAMSIRAGIRGPVRRARGCARAAPRSSSCRASRRR